MSVFVFVPVHVYALRQIAGKIGNITRTHTITKLFNG